LIPIRALQVLHADKCRSACLEPLLFERPPAGMFSPQRMRSSSDEHTRRKLIVDAHSVDVG